jgi:hypothetical protein
MSPPEHRAGGESDAEERLGAGTDALAHRIAADGAPGSAATILPPLLAQEQVPAFVASPAADGAASDQRLLRAWKDTHVQNQTHVALFVVLTIAGLALGISLGLD